MKLKTLAAMSALALAGISGQASATLCTAAGVPYASCAGNEVADGPFGASTGAPVVDVYLTGASAPQRFLGSMAAQLFGANTSGFNSFWVFYDNGVSGTAGASYRAYQGRLTADVTDATTSTTIPAGTMVRIINRAKGGSVWGVNPLARNQSVAWMPITPTNCASVVSSTRSHECGQAGDDLALTGRAPDFGVSDVEPRMFKGPLNVEFGQSALSDSELNNLTNKAVNGLLFGVAATAAVPAGTEFTRAKVSALLAGAILDWNKINTAIPAGTPVVICRRVQGSGTQATFNAYFNNFPCATGSIYGVGSTSPQRMADSDGYDASVPGAITVDASAGVTIVENPSSSNVATCLTRAQSGGNHTFTSDDGRAVTVQFGTGGYLAIGNLSRDSSESPGVWTFRDLNGNSPLKANMRTGKYDFWSELSMQTNNTTFAGFAANKKALINEFIRRSGDPTILSTITGDPGLATVALPISFTPNETTGTNVAYVTSFGNSCAPKRTIK